MVDDTLRIVHQNIQNNKRIIAEGANAAMIDIDFGSYPYVTSSNTTIGGIVTGLGVAPELIETKIGIVKAYSTRVGGGPFIGELFDEVGEHF